MILEYLNWLHNCRKNWSHNDSYWNLAYKIKTVPNITTKIFAGIDDASYNFSPAKKILKSDGQMTTIWLAQDSLILKHLAETLKAKLNFSKYVVSNKGSGGISKAIKTVNKLIKTHKYIYRSDVKSFYNSINHELLLQRMKKFTTGNEHKLVSKHLDRIEWQNGEYIEIKQGISKSSPLSPVLGCIYLDELDRAMEKQDVKYLRYADDWIILAKTKHKLRKAVKKCKQILDSLKIEEHPDKTDYRNYNTKTSPNLRYTSGESLATPLSFARRAVGREFFKSCCIHANRYLCSEEDPCLRGNGYSFKPFNFLGVEFNQTGAKDIKKETKHNFLMKISRLYEYIQAIMKIKLQLNTDYLHGGRLYNYLNILELEIIKKFIRSMEGFIRYSNSMIALLQT